MKKSALALFASAVAGSAAAAVVFDPAARSVSFTASSTDCGEDTSLEFLIVGPDSDRGYESMFVADDPVQDIAAAFDRAGIPRGKPYDRSSCVFWPEGATLSIEPSFDSLVADSQDRIPGIVYTAGSRAGNDVPDAATNMPSAVFALYNCPQSLLQIDDSLEQSPTYGRFKPARKIAKGEKATFTFRWNGKTDTKSISLPVRPGELEKTILYLKSEAAKSPLSAVPDFSPSLTVAEAVKAAQALSMVESRRIKINGVKEGQFYYRAYEPLEKWRDRRERLAQPPEVRFLPDGRIKVVEILEDWSDPDSLDPKLSARETIVGSVAEAAKILGPLARKTSTALVFAPSGEKLSRLFELKKLSSSEIETWYVFGE